MSSIRNAQISDYTPADDSILSDDIAPSVVHPKPKGSIGFIARFMPVLRRPPALLLEVRTGQKDMAFDSLIETHVARYRERGANDIAYGIADFMVRRLPELEEGRLSRDAVIGLDNLTETVTMFEHIHIAQTSDGP